MESISYYSEDAWRKYFNVDLADFYSCVAGFLNIRDKVIQQISDQTIGELIKNSELWKTVFFGGFTADESKPYHENALAKFYDEVFGIGVSDISAVISRLKEGSTLESATEDIKPTIREETPIIRRLSELKPKLETIYKILRDIVDKPSAKEYKIEDSFFGLNALRDILNTGKRLLPLYNPLSFFIMSVYSIPKFYVQEAYPKLFEEDTKKILEKYDIRIVRLLEPDLPDEKIRSERAIIGLARDCVGYLLRDIILDIYSLFQIESLAKFFNVEDEFAKFVKMNAGKLKQSIVVSQFSDIISKIKEAGYSESSLGPCKISSPFELKYREGEIESGIAKISYGTKLNYTEFFAFLAPIMFLGLAYARPTSEKIFKWCCLLGWER
jgi:hypothetical protein